LPRFTWFDPCKVVAEFVVALGLAVLTAPVILLAAVVIRLTSRGPAFYLQTRLGRAGRPYTLYKLRTMVHDCERQSGPCWSPPNDPRITPLGRFLRRTHLDELPQLWNVLQGDMSLVGPRPERPELVPALAAALCGYRLRLLVRPGLTGLAQVQLPADVDLASVARKLTYDLYYVRHRSPGMDLRLLLATALHLVGVPAPRIRKTLRLPTAAAIAQAYWELTGEKAGVSRHAAARHP
jgi:lipopolysaccharide/colanic/teichoic acid biosynthesis glycosyltransferase